MADKSSTHRGNCFYTLASIDKVAEDTRATASSPFLRMRRAEAAILAVVRAAADPNVIAFPVRKRFRCGVGNRKTKFARK